LKEYLEAMYKVYMFPARFPAKIFELFFKKLEGKGLIFDPFAGSGSLAIASFLQCYESEVWDINPMIHVIVDASIKLLKGYNVKKALKLVKHAMRYGRPWLPDGAEYWWPSDALDLLGKVWGFFRENMSVFNEHEMRFSLLDEMWSLYAIIALYASRKISYTDDSVPKWYKSKLKVNKMNTLLFKTSPKKLFERYAERKAKTLMSIQKIVPKPSCNPDITIRVLDAIATNNYPENPIGVLTSPPYLQAQEYIRSFRWELKLLGVPSETITNLRKLEIPYREPVDIEIMSKKYHEIHNSIAEEKYRKVLRSYFTNILLVLERSVSSMKIGVTGIFVGDATLRGITIPIIDIFKEHLTTKLRLQEIADGELNDKIRRRRLFKQRKNLNPDGIQVEHLVFLKKP